MLPLPPEKCEQSITILLLINQNQKPKKVERCKKVNLKPFFPIMLSLFESRDAFEVNQPIFLEEERKEN